MESALNATGGEEVTPVDPRIHGAPVLDRMGQTFDSFAPAAGQGRALTAFRLELSIGTDLGFSIASYPCWAQTLRSSEAGRLRPLREFKR
jgi:hypothetical protein